MSGRSKLAPYFDADAYLASLTRPQVRIDNIEYTGRLLSIEEWLEYEALFDQISDAAAEGDGRKSVAEMRGFAERYLRAVFPREDLPWYVRLAGRDPVPKLLALPHAALTDLLGNFVVAQLRSMRRTTETPTIPTGPSSSD